MGKFQLQTPSQKQNDPNCDNISRLMSIKEGMFPLPDTQLVTVSQDYLISTIRCHIAIMLRTETLGG